MKITRTDPFTGQVNTLDIDVTQDQIDAWKAGKLIQDAMPLITSSEREFIKTGITEKSWNSMFGNNENFDVMNEVGDTGWTQD